MMTKMCSYINAGNAGERHVEYIKIESAEYIVNFDLEPFGQGDSSSINVIAHMQKLSLHSSEKQQEKIKLPSYKRPF